MSPPILCLHLWSTSLFANAWHFTKIRRSDRMFLIARGLFLMMKISVLWKLAMISLTALSLQLVVWCSRRLTKWTRLSASCRLMSRFQRMVCCSTRKIRSEIARKMRRSTWRNCLTRTFLPRRRRCFPTNKATGKEIKSEILTMIWTWKKEILISRRKISMMNCFDSTWFIL